MYVRSKSDGFTLRVLDFVMVVGYLWRNIKLLGLHTWLKHPLINSIDYADSSEEAVDSTKPTPPYSYGHLITVQRSTGADFSREELQMCIFCT